MDAAGTTAAKGAGRLADAAARAEPAVAGPSGAKAELTRIVSPYAALLPSFDRAAANAAARMLGARQFPTPPWRRHIEGEAA